MICEYCGKRIDGWYLRYKGKTFCEDANNTCIKNYLYEEHDKEIEEDREFTDEYNMDEIDYVTFMEQRGLG